MHPEFSTKGPLRNSWHPSQDAKCTQKLRRLAAQFGFDQALGQLHTVAMLSRQWQHVLAMPPRLGKSQANAERGVGPQHFALFRSVGFVERQRCAQTPAWAMEIVVGQFRFSELSTGPTGTRSIDIWAPHCGALLISGGACFSEAAVLSNNRRGQWSSVFEKSVFFFFENRVPTL